MKSIRKSLVSAVWGTCLLTGGAFANSLSFDAAASFGTDPAMYSNIVNLGNGLYRADIVCENLPNILAASFRIDIGEGWSFVLDGTEAEYENPLHFTISTSMPSASIAYFGMARGSEVNPNSTILSVYLNKTNLYSSSTASINFIFLADDGFYTMDDHHYNPDSNIYPLLNPEMIASYEFLFGDVNGDGQASAVDASLISVALCNNNNNSIDVNGPNIYFPNAIALEVADVDRDGYITSYDAQYVLTYYSYVSGGLIPVGTYYTGEWMYMKNTLFERG